MKKNEITLLYLDDEHINLFLFESAFKEKYRVLTAETPFEALAKLEDRHHEIIVVISDMNMPGMDGIEFIEKAKSKYQNISYSILTAYEYNDRIDKALKSGTIHHFFTKPFNISEIEEAIDQVVNRSK